MRRQGMSSLKNRAEAADWDEYDEENDVFLEENRLASIVDKTDPIYHTFTRTTLLHACLCEVFCI